MLAVWRSRRTTRPLVGGLADGVPVGWGGVSPRSTIPRLEQPTLMLLASDPWAVVWPAGPNCFSFVIDRRALGLTSASADSPDPPHNSKPYNGSAVHVLPSAHSELTDGDGMRYPLVFVASVISLGTLACSTHDAGVNRAAPTTTAEPITTPSSPTDGSGAARPDAPGQSMSLTAAEDEFCRAAASEASSLTQGSDDLDNDIGLKDVASGGGGSVGSWTDMALAQLSHEAAAAATDGGAIQPELTGFVRTPRASARGGWSDRDAMLVGQRFLGVQIACKMHGVDPVETGTTEDWNNLVEWVSGITPEDNPFTAGQFCQALAQDEGLDAFDSVLSDPELGPSIAGMVGASALYECPQHLELAANIINDS